MRLTFRASLSSTDQERKEGAADADERLGKTRRRRRLGGDRRRRQRLRWCAVTTPADHDRGPAAAQALRRRRPVPRHHRHEASALWLRAVSLSALPLPGANRAAQAGAVSAAVA